MSASPADDQRAAPGRDELKQMVCDEIERRAGEIEAISDHILRHPETGYKEFRTAAYVAEVMRNMGLAPREGLAITGVKARMAGRDTGDDRPRTTVGILGELDSLVSAVHPHADPETGAAHTCGHNAMTASMLGAGMGLAAVMDRLDGDVVLFAVPAEEGIETDFRLGLRAAGKLQYLQGKPELIRLGEFDDVDMTLNCHTAVDTDPWLACPGHHTIGAVHKHAYFHGKAAHAGAYPENGVNALKAATLAMSAIDMQRETFRDDDRVRVHWRVASGGEAVSSVPAEVELDIMVRAATVAALNDACGKVDRALRAGAMALGCTLDIETASGVLPMRLDPNLAGMVEANQVALLGAPAVGQTGQSTAGTDVGDLAAIMPVCQALATGVNGTQHTDHYMTTDHRVAAVNPAKFMAMTVVDLLWDGAAEARRVLDEAAPRLMTSDEFMALRDGQEGIERFEGPA